ncbi:MAG: insulinase family protein, partial [Candidatus Tectimicrobiota bacterium]
MSGRRPLLVGLLAALALVLLVGPARPEVHGRAAGPPPTKQSTGAKRIEAMTFPPLELTIPRVGREVERLTLEDGLILYLMEDHTLPVFDLRATVRTGSLYTFRDRPGLAVFAGSQMREGGTEAYSPEELNRRLEHMAASIETGAGTESLNASLSSLSKDLDEGLALFAEVFLRP